MSQICYPTGNAAGVSLSTITDGFILFYFQGYLIPKDWSIVYSIRETQHTSPLYDDAEKFNPDRWYDLDRMSEESGADVTRFHYVPFGFGARGCIGKIYAQLVVKIFLIELVQSCSWTLKNTDITMMYIPATVSTDHLPAVFKRREEGSTL